MIKLLSLLALFLFCGCMGPVLLLTTAGMACDEKAMVDNKPMDVCLARALHCVTKTIDTVICRDSIVHHEYDPPIDYPGWPGTKLSECDTMFTICDTVWVEEAKITGMKGKALYIKSPDKTGYGLRLPPAEAPWCIFTDEYRDSTGHTCPKPKQKPDQKVIVRLSPAQYEKLLDLLEPCRKGCVDYKPEYGKYGRFACTRCGKVK